MSKATGFAWLASLAVCGSAIAAVDTGFSRSPEKAPVDWCGILDVDLPSLHDRWENVPADSVLGFPLPTGQTVNLDLHRWFSGLDKGVDVPVAMNGIIAGHPESLVSITVTSDWINGMIDTGDEIFLISNGSADRPDAKIAIYSISDAAAHGVITIKGECGVNTRNPKLQVAAPPAELIHTGRPVLASEEVNPNDPSPEGMPPPPTYWGGVGSSACSYMYIAFDSTNSAYKNVFGQSEAAVVAYGISLTAAMSTIYERDFGVQLVLRAVNVRTGKDQCVQPPPNPLPDLTDPYSTLSGAGNFLSKIAELWQTANGDSSVKIWSGASNLFRVNCVPFGSIHSGAVVLLSDTFNDSQSGIAGLANLPGICDNTRKYAVTGAVSGLIPNPIVDNRNANWDIILVAHELGHVFSNIHTHEMDPPADLCPYGDCTVARQKQGTIMSYCHTCPGGASNIKLQFHPRNISSTKTFLSYIPVDKSAIPSGDCLTAIRSNLWIVPSSPGNVPLRDLFSVSFEVFSPSIQTFKWYKDDVDITNVWTADRPGVWHVLDTGTNGAVQSVTQTMGGLLVAGGTFTTAGGKPLTNLAAFVDGSWQEIGSGNTVNGAVNAVFTTGDDMLIVGGAFTSMAGVANATRIAAWDGLVWSSMGTGANNTVRAIYSPPFGGFGAVYAGGDFTNMGGTAVNRIAKWNGTAWAALGAGLNNTVRGITSISTGEIIVVGDFTTAGGAAANRIAKWSGSAWSTLGTGFNNSTTCVTVTPSGLIVVGGSFTTANGAAANRIATWNGTTWSALGSGLNNTVNAVGALPNGDIIAAGSFTTAGGNAIANIARWNSTTSTWVPIDTGVNGAPNTLVVLRNADILTAGSFTTAGQVSAANIARWYWDGVSPTSATAFPYSGSGVYLWSSTYTNIRTMFPDVGDYAAAAISVCNSAVFSPKAHVEPVLKCSADFNRDGIIDIFDFQDFMECFEGGQCPPGLGADYWTDGFIDIYDLNAFLTDFEAGCP